MTERAANIKVVVAAGVPAHDAIKASLPGTLAQFAIRNGFYKAHVSACVYGRVRHEKIRAALSRELAVDREWLDELLDGRREKVPA